MRQDNLLSYADLERIGWPLSLIDDYLGLKRELLPQHGTASNPNGLYIANLNGLYIKTDATTALWFNPSPGADTGWVQIS